MRSEDEIRKHETWKSWTFVLYDALPSYLGVNGLSFDHELTTIIKSKMEHSGSLFGIPQLPVSYSERSILPGFNLKDLIAVNAARAMMDKAMRKVFADAKEDIEKNGLDAIRKYYPAIPEQKP